MPGDQFGDRLEWGIEVEFLVAKERRGSSSPGDDTRWACPADDPNPPETCAKHCAEIIEKYALRKGRVVGGVGYRGDDAPAEDAGFHYLDRSAARSGIVPSMSHWFFCPAPDASPREGSPEGLDWVGIRMRCPLRPYSRVMPRGEEMAELDSTSESSDDAESDADSTAASAGSSGPSVRSERTPSPPPKRRNRLEMETLLALLRAGIKMHVNSTCQLRTHFALRPDGFEVVHVKKLLTFCWMMEQHLMLVLRPGVKDPKKNHYLPVTECSRLALQPSLFPGGYMEFSSEECHRLLRENRPAFELEAAEMDRHIPSKFNDSCLQQRIQQIWSATTIGELSELLESPDGETTVAIQVHGGKAHPTIQFRYSVWHPEAEAMQNWLQLFGRLCYASVGSQTSRFYDIISAMEVNILQAQKHEPVERWKTVLTHIFHNSMSYYWDLFRQARFGKGILTEENLDNRGILERVPGIILVDDDKNNSDSNSSNSS
ncbi:hypothetical protein QQZ08_011470 [Neonectria magnoliae]|uniref:Uncharacterized protein n=1 Tax=Neonectria magnoliae TaxID=2732573 RepID=A0ABR1HAI5_9HYPO